MCEELFWGNEEEKILLTATFLRETKGDTVDQISVIATNFITVSSELNITLSR